MTEDYDLDFDVFHELRVLNRHCTFCGRSRPPEIEDMDWWYPTECGHACCSKCARRISNPETLEFSQYALCPACDQDDSRRN